MKDNGKIMLQMVMVNFQHLFFLGRLIHSDGDVYEGDWVDDKA